MTAPGEQLRVFYAGACPSCVKDRRLYERLAGRTGESVEWVDITGRDEELKERGIDPQAALQELHVEDSQGNIHRELDAYILLMSRVWLLKPLAWLIGLPVIRPALAKLYHKWVIERLERTGRMPDSKESQRSIEARKAEVEDGKKTHPGFAKIMIPGS